MAKKSDEEVVDSVLMDNICSILEDFWTCIHSLSLPPQDWQNNDLFAPWYAFQKAIEEQFLTERNELANKKNAKSEDNEKDEGDEEIEEDKAVLCESLTLISFSKFHHLIFSKNLKIEYQRCGTSPLDSEKIINLLVRLGRCLGYMGKSEHDYPLAKIKKMLGAKNTHEIGKLKSQITLFAVLFYLIHQYCNQEQVALIKQLISFRFPTTFEEECSEHAIFDCLVNRETSWTFLKRYENFFHLNEEVKLEETLPVESRFLTAIKEFLPCTSKDFFGQLGRKMDKKPWRYIFKARTNQGELNQAELVDTTFELFRTNLVCNQKTYYLEALRFVSLVREDFPLFTQVEQTILSLACYLFCLNAYAKQRQLEEDKESSLMGETKCAAATKKIAILRGKKTDLGFFENWALSQGRLGELVSWFEEGEVPDSLRL